MRTSAFSIAATLMLVAALAIADKTVLHVYVPEERENRELADALAQELLADWDRSVPQSVRNAENHVALRESVLQPEPGSALQFNSALVRLANAAALPYIRADLTGLSDEDALERLQQCVEYLLGITGSTVACNLFPIAP